MFMKSQLYSSVLFGLNDIRAGEGCVWIFKVQNVAVERGVIANQRKARAIQKMRVKLF